MSRSAAHGAERITALEVSFVFGDNYTVVCFSHCGNDHIKGAPGPPFCRSFSHQSGPDQARLFVERQYSTGEQCLRTFGAGKPTLQLSAFLSGGLLQDAAADLGDGQGRDKQVLVGLPTHPSNQRFRWRRFGGIADDVRVE